MRPYSLDLRDLVAAACQQPQRTIAQVAAQFSVSISFVDKLLGRQRRTGSLAAKPHAGGPPPRLDATAFAQLVACLQQRPDATLTELQAALLAAGGPAVSRTLICRRLRAQGWRRKKRVSTPPSATPSE